MSLWREMLSSSTTPIFMDLDADLVITVINVDRGRNMVGGNKKGNGRMSATHNSPAGKHTIIF